MNVAELAAAWWRALLDGMAQREAPDLAAPVVIGVIVAAVVLSVPRGSWRWFGLYVTFVHELGHAVAALMSGRAIHGLRIGLDHSGQLLSSGRSRFGVAWSGFWGYPAPALVGSLFIWAVTAGWAGATLSISAVVLPVSLLLLRNFTGFIVALGCAAIAQVLLLAGNAEGVSYVLMAFGVALGVGAVRDWCKVTAVHLQHRQRLQSSDAYLLARATGIPSVLWLTAFAAVIGICSAFSALQLWSLAM